MLGGQGLASPSSDVRKQSMNFAWHEAPSACERDCGMWISAVGIINSETPAQFDTFIGDRTLKNVTVVLDSNGGSVLDAIRLGRRWRDLGLRTTVGAVTEKQSAGIAMRRIVPDAASCESMCVFLLLAGRARSVPEGAHVRVHQIWMGDRADNPKAASYSSDDMMIVERDVGRLAKYTFDMGGSGDLLSLALSVPPWEPLHELSADELRLTNLVTGDVIADEKGTADGVTGKGTSKMAQDKPLQDRFAADAASREASPEASTRTAEVHAPTGGAAGAAPDAR